MAASGERDTEGRRLPDGELSLWTEFWPEMFWPGLGWCWVAEAAAEAWRVEVEEAEEEEEEEEEEEVVPEEDRELR